MRILYITNGFPPERWAGTETYTANLAVEFGARGAAVAVLCGGDWHTADTHFCGTHDSFWRHVRVRRVHQDWTKAPDPFLWLYDNPSAERETLRMLDEHRPDVVHVTSCETLSASVLRAVHSRSVPLVLTLTDFWFLCPRITLLRSDDRLCDGNTTSGECITCLARHSRAYRWPRTLLPESLLTGMLGSAGRIPWVARRRGFRGVTGDVAHRKAFLQSALTWPNLLMTASPFVRRLHQRCGVRTPIQVRPYGHDLSWLKPARSRNHSVPLTIGFIGQIVPSKGVHLLLEAVRLLAPEMQNQLRVMVYGDVATAGEYGRRLLSLASSLPHVEFRGTYLREDSADTYGSLDVLVVPSMWYDFPLVIHEAFAAKTPVVASRLGGMEEAVTDGRDGLLFDRNDVHGLAAHIARLLREPPLLQHLQNNIRSVRTITEDVDELTVVYAGLTKQTALVS